MDKIPEGHTMRSAPARIKFVTDEIKPLCIQKARRIPLHQEDEAKQITEDMIQRGIIVKQRASGYSRCCSPATFVPKKPVGLRLVTDYTHLNRYIDRPVHPFPTTEDIQRSISAESRYFAKIDLVSAYHQARSSNLTTMATMVGGTFLLW